MLCNLFVFEEYSEHTLCFIATYCWFFVGSNFVLSRSAGCGIDRPVAEEAEVCGLGIIKLIFM